MFDMSGMTAADGFGEHREVGRRIEKRRRQLRLTQAALAEQIGVPLGTLSRFEAGTADPAGCLERIAEVTGKPVVWFMSGDSAVFVAGGSTRLVLIAMSDCGSPS